VKYLTFIYNNLAAKCLGTSIEAFKAARETRAAAKKGQITVIESQEVIGAAKNTIASRERIMKLKNSGEAQYALAKELLGHDQPRAMGLTMLLPLKSVQSPVDGNLIVEEQE
jgi:hypothetical protein